MKALDALTFRYEINEQLHKGKTFDQIFENEQVLLSMMDFTETKIGQKWLQSDQGKSYSVWQNR